MSSRSQALPRSVRALNWCPAPLSTQALASQVFGLYAGFVYFTPLLGGMIADRWIGQRAAVVIGALAMSAGHLAMTFDESFLIALLLLVIGSGFLKGNITAQVGSLYPKDDEARSLLSPAPERIEPRFDGIKTIQTTACPLGQRMRV